MEDEQELISKALLREVENSGILYSHDRLCEVVCIGLWDIIPTLQFSQVDVVLTRLEDDCQLIFDPKIKALIKPTPEQIEKEKECRVVGINGPFLKESMTTEELQEYHDRA